MLGTQSHIPETDFQLRRTDEDLDQLLQSAGGNVPRVVLKQFYEKVSHHPAVTETDSSYVTRAGRLRCSPPQRSSLSISSTGCHDGLSSCPYTAFVQFARIRSGKARVLLAGRANHRIARHRGYICCMRCRLAKVSSKANARKKADTGIPIVSGYFSMSCFVNPKEAQ